jgi:hypothetical protein
MEIAMKRTLLTLSAMLFTVSALALSAGTDLFIPAVAHGTGAAVNGVSAQWRSDIWIFNPSSTQVATVSLYLLLRNQANPSPTARTVAVTPGETRYLRDVILETFGADNTYGALHVTSALPVVVTSVSYDANVNVAQKGIGASGQYYTAIPADWAIGTGSLTDLVGLDQDGQETSGTWRSNLALVETTGHPLNIVIERRDGTGSLVGSIPYHLGAWEVRQLNTVITTVAPSTGTNERIRVRATLGDGRFIAAASRINNASGDPSTVEMIGAHQIGRFQGLLLNASGSSVEGGLELRLGSGGLLSFKGLASISCNGEGSFFVEVASDPLGGPVALNPDGTLSTLVSIPYAGEHGVAFTTDWTLAGVHNPDGTWSGTLAATTHGGTGDFAECNGIGVTRQWRASWSGSL